MKKRIAIATAALTLVLGTPALAGRTIHLVDVSTVNTNWGTAFNPIHVPKHDASLGQLQKVFICVRGRVSRQLKVESRDSQPATVGIRHLSSGILFQQPCDPTRTITSTRGVYPDLSLNLTAYDGQTDYGGTSGHDTGIVYRGMGPVLIDLAGPDIACFTGTGDVEIPVEIQFGSDISGPGNLFVETTSTATIRGVVIYEY